MIGSKNRFEDGRSFAVRNGLFNFGTLTARGVTKAYMVVASIDMLSSAKR
jgi:hypothetical protein